MQVMVVLEMAFVSGVFLCLCYTFSVSFYWLVSWWSSNGLFSERIRFHYSQHFH